MAHFKAAYEQCLSCFTMKPDQENQATSDQVRLLRARAPQASSQIFSCQITQPWQMAGMWEAVPKVLLLTVTNSP